MRSARAARRWPAVAAVVTVVGATSGVVGSSGAPAAAATGGASIGSVVVLGDSVAAGEGTLDGYVYQDRGLLPGWTNRSSGATAKVHGCGRSALAYGSLVGRAFDARVTNLACSGASFEHGIDLDARYDRARPDLVLVTAGANSVSFERAFAYCVVASRGVGDTDAARLANSSSIADALVGAVRAAVGGTGTTGAGSVPGCTHANPGAYLQNTVVDHTDTIASEAKALAESIRARGRAAGHVPQVVFTTYPDPLPHAAESFAACPDGVAVGAAQLAYMHALVAQMNGALADGLRGVPGVTVVDADPAFAGHRWCDADPWMYGPSILLGNPSSWAPFHPTPAGQRAIAEAVLAAVGGGSTNGRTGGAGVTGAV